MRAAKVMRVIGTILIVLGMVHCARAIMVGERLEMVKFFLEASLLLCVGAWLVQRTQRRCPLSDAQTTTGQPGHEGSGSFYAPVARVGLTLGLLLLGIILLCLLGLVLFFLWFMFNFSLVKRSLVKRICGRFLAPAVLRGCDTGPIPAL